MEPESFGLKEELVKLGCRKCEIDTAMFSCIQETSMLSCRRFCHGGDKYFEEKKINLCGRKNEERNFNYIGFRINQESNIIILDQSYYMYVENMTNKVIDSKRASLTKYINIRGTSSVQTAYWSSQLGCTGNQTRFHF